MLNLHFISGASLQQVLYNLSWLNFYFVVLYFLFWKSIEYITHLVEDWFSFFFKVVHCFIFSSHSNYIYTFCRSPKKSNQKE